MNNPFDVIEARLSNIENLLLDIKHAPKSVEDLPDRISFQEVCKITGLKEPSVYKETSTGTMPCSRMGNRLVFSRKEILQWMQEKTIRKQNLNEVAASKLQTSAKKKDNTK